MFAKILIANRGEIACRVIATAQEMGIKTVAVYSKADERAPHVAMADEAVMIGPSPSSESYLVIDNIIDAARRTGADAIHPGYGFLSENAAFAEALAMAGVAFIGPGADAIKAMGDKIESKKLASAAGVSTIPGWPDVIADAEEAVRIAGDIGYPVMVKASAGGGGKGMRVAFKEDEVEECFVSASNEARSSFGDDRIFIEKFIENPRHIEIQVLADGQGGIVHLGERECSIQRRHQKVIEEAPSPFLDPKTRVAMGAQAIKLARAVGYKSAGTVEFVVDRDQNFYFLEMNTRLQVEHPVTEQVTGIDLVEQMIRIAYGETLDLRQEDISFNGWAIEARIYAEDPFRNFLPSIGRLTRYLPPESSPNIRVDSGVVEGGEISMFYDPMIAKLVATGETRDVAISYMRDALDAYYIRGVSHNIPFLNAVMTHPRFISGDLTTAFIDETYGDGFSLAHMAQDDPTTFVAVAAVARDIGERRQSDGGTYVAIIRDGAETLYEISKSEKGWSVQIGETVVQVETDWRPGEPLCWARIDGGAAICVQVDRDGEWLRLGHAGRQADILILLENVAALNRLMPHKEPPDMSRFLLSPMPGLLVQIAVAEGDAVKAGETLAVVEAMKMENVLRAEHDGVVKSLHAGNGDSLKVDQQILEFE
ncbi:MAG: acetyl/propionyl/methylcrotonyl-CoA carboxylase subunit alpha [Alphaproteobacteria bacterium]|nr:acetyl/propionyl/methylcrotonyl-CoA carboxylase subunit alpha [Alphaproteobacteria bacterium]